MGKVSSALLALAGSVAAAQAQGADDLGRWHAGPYSYSDEMGGFAITGISGTGTLDDPATLYVELLSASPVTMRVLAEAPIRPRFVEGNFANGFIYLRIVALNNSGLPWLEFEFELQEALGEPSTFGDGLSFDQRKTDSKHIGSDRYAEYNRDYEPFDRLLFRDGYTDPMETASFHFFLTDFTPRWQYFIVLDPTIPSS